jgi:hypothetical protein
MRRNARASLAGRQRNKFAWFLIAALLLSSVASIVPTFTNPTSVDAATRMIKMPFASGANWTISQGYNTGPTGGSHYNCATTGCSWKYKYSFDLVRSDGNTSGQSVLSPVNGTIRWIDEYYGGMSINLGNGWAVAYFHTTLKAGLAAGQSVVQGQYLGAIAPPGQGGNGGYPHLHITLWRTTDGGNWSRDAKPFTGEQSLDGYDFPALADSQTNQYRSRTVTSSNALVGSGATIPSQVAKVSPVHGATLADSTPTFTWSQVANATSYQVAIDPGTAAEQYSIWVTGTSWTAPALPLGEHTWKVRARNSVGTGTWSSTWRFSIATQVAGDVLNNGAKIGTGTYKVFGTREGLVGGTTSSGHVIVANDHFVSLPACVKTTCTWLTPGTTHSTYGYVTDCGSKCYVIVRNPANNVCRVEPVLDRGPWFNVDNYWNSASNRFVNKKIAAKGLDYSLAQGYPADAAAFAGYDVGWGRTQTTSGWRGNTNLVKNGSHYPVTFQTSIDIADGTWLELGFPWDPGPRTVVVTMLWQVSTSVADAEAACEGPATPPPYFTMSRSSGIPGTVVTVNGKYYGKNETVRVYLDSASTTPLATATTDAEGRFSTSFTVPDTLGGPHRLHIVGHTSKLRTARTFKILPRASSSRTSGPANLTLTMSGRNFAAGEVVDVFWDGGTTVAGTGTADSAGKVQIAARSPKTNGLHTARLKGRTNLLSASTSYTVVQRVRVSPSSASAGTTITAIGSGWPANKTVSFRWNSRTGTVLCSAISAADGSVRCTFRAPSSPPAGEYRVYGTDGTLSASAAFILTLGVAENPTAVPTATSSATPQSPASPEVSETPTVGPTETALPTDTPAPTEALAPTEPPTAIPTETPAPRTVDVAAAADTSVTYANPDTPQPAELVGSLRAGGPETAVAYVSFSVAGIGSGTVTEAYLILTGTSGGGSGGTIAAVPGYLVNEAGTYRSLPTQDLTAAVTRDGAASAFGTVGAGEVVWIDVGGTVQADGQYTFVILGDAAQLLELSSREGGSPPLLRVTIQD